VRVPWPNRSYAFARSRRSVIVSSFASRTVSRDAVRAREAVTNNADGPKASVADIDTLFWGSRPIPSHNVRVIDDNHRLQNDANSGTKTGPFAACFVVSRRRPTKINPAKSSLNPNLWHLAAPPPQFRGISRFTHARSRRARVGGPKPPYPREPPYDCGPDCWCRN
jgi:hypothetical protein